MNVEGFSFSYFMYKLNLAHSSYGWSSLWWVHKIGKKINDIKVQKFNTITNRDMKKK
jgi:hypothetical protein